MGNLHCPGLYVAPLAPVARDICPFSNYNPSPLFVKMLSFNSSLHLKDHYTAVQTSLTPGQLEDFTQSLRTTFGREVKVTYGGMGVVALSLAVLFDTLAKQVRGQWVSETEPIPGLFVKDLRGYYPPHLYTISKYLRLVPHIANNPTRMREETERYIKQLAADEESLDKLGDNHTLPLKEDITAFNLILSDMFATNMHHHHERIKNPTDDHLFWFPKRMWFASAVGTVFNLNCDPEAADKDFFAEVQRSDNRTQEAFQRHISNAPETWLLKVVEEDWGTTMNDLTCYIKHLINESRIDFDLKADALGKWAE